MCDLQCGFWRALKFLFYIFFFFARRPKLLVMTSNIFMIFKKKIKNNFIFALKINFIVFDYFMHHAVILSDAVCVKLNVMSITN